MEDFHCMEPKRATCQLETGMCILKLQPQDGVCQSIRLAQVHEVYSKLKGTPLEGQDVSIVVKTSIQEECFACLECRGDQNEVQYFLLHFSDRHESERFATCLSILSHYARELA